MTDGCKMNRETAAGVSTRVAGWDVHDRLMQNESETEAEPQCVCARQHGPRVFRSPRCERQVWTAAQLPVRWVSAHQSAVMLILTLQ